MREKSRGVTRVVTLMVLALLASLTSITLASPASAAPTPYAYTLGAGDPTLTAAPLGADSQGPCVAGTGSGSYAYEVKFLKVSADGAYAVADGGVGDGRVGIYSGVFDPANPVTNCLAFVDVDESVTLAAATTYLIVLSTGTTGATGGFSVTFDGPGTASVLDPTTTTLTSSPATSELSKPTTLRAVVTGGATPTGSVQFREGAKLLGSAALVSGTAQLVVSSLKVGSHALTATYSGDSTHAASSDGYVHTVKYGPKPRARLKVSDKSVFVGATVKLTWKTKYADSVKARGAWKGKRAKKGSKKVKIKKLGRNVFKLRVSNVNGTRVAKVKVTATRAPKDFTVTLEDDIAAAGTQVKVSATKLDPKEPYKVFLDQKQVLKGLANRKGLVNVLVPLPQTLVEGEHVLKLVGSNAARLGTVDLLVVAPTKELDMTLKKAAVKVNKTQTVTVGGLVEGEDLTLSYNGTVLVQGVADADGEYSYTFPVGPTVGSKTVTVVGHVPGRTAQRGFEVQKGAGRALSGA